MPTTWEIVYLLRRLLWELILVAKTLKINVFSKGSYRFHKWTPGKSNKLVFNTVFFQLIFFAEHPPFFRGVRRCTILLYNFPGNKTAVHVVDGILVHFTLLPVYSNKLAEPKLCNCSLFNNFAVQHSFWMLHASKVQCHIETEVSDR